MPAPKFSFIAERQLGKDTESSGFTVSVTTAGFLYFNKETIEIYDLKDKYIRIFVDMQKKAVGWSYCDKELDNFKDARQIHPNSVAGSAVVSIQKIMKKLGLEGKKFKDLPVQTYKSSLMDFPVYYIQLEKLVDQE